MQPTMAYQLGILMHHKAGFVIAHYKRNEAMKTVRPVSGPHTWKRQELEADTSWISNVSPSEALELRRAVELTVATGTAPGAIRRSDFLLPRLAERLTALERDIEHGRGFAVLRGLPLEGMSDAEIRVLACGVGAHLGIPVSQSKNGEFLAEVKDIGVKKGTPDSRAYRTGGELRFHTDRCDLLALLCVRAARVGGMSKVVSSSALHNELLARRPDMVEQLYGTYDFSRQSEEAPGEAPWHSSPVFAVQDGCFSSQFSQSFIESAQKYLPVPRLLPAQKEAIETLAALAEEMSFQLYLEPGDLQLLNNHVVYHSRTHYEDHIDPAQKRLLLRLWLSTPESRPLSKNERDVWGSNAPGAVRGGVQPAQGRRYAFADWQDAGWRESAIQG